MRPPTNDVGEHEQRFTLRSLATLQQRIEASRTGQILISALVVVILGTGVASNLPDSPIARGVATLAKPIGEDTGLDIRWAMFAPDPPRRNETIDVDVTMADGQHVTWSLQPGDKVIGTFAWVHWMNLMTRVVNNPEIRPALAQWVVRLVTPPNARAVRVAVILRTENVSRPGGNESKSPATKVLYQDDIAGPQ